MTISGSYWQWIALAASVGTGAALYGAVADEFRAWRENRRPPWTIEVRHKLDGSIEVSCPRPRNDSERKVLDAALRYAKRFYDRPKPTPIVRRETTP
jgi:hypothetical protein